MGKAYAMGALLIIVGVFAMTHEQEYQEKKHNPKYDAKAQIVAACNRIISE